MTGVGRFLSPIFYQSSKKLKPYQRPLQALSGNTGLDAIVHCSVEMSMELIPNLLKLGFYVAFTFNQVVAGSNPARPTIYICDLL